MILIACALPEELAEFVPDTRSTLLACGIGPVEAATAVMRALADRSYDAVVSVGIAGAFREHESALRVGDACIIGEEVFADFGWENDEDPHLPGNATLARRVAADAEFLHKAKALPYPIVRGLTTARVTTTHATEFRLLGTHDAAVESMESFAVLRAAQLARVPAIGVRGISNYVGPRTAGEWDFHAGRCAAIAALRFLLDALGT